MYNGCCISLLTIILLIQEDKCSISQTIIDKLNERKILAKNGKNWAKLRV